MLKIQHILFPDNIFISMLTIKLMHLYMSKNRCRSIFLDFFSFIDDATVRLNIFQIKKLKLKSVINGSKKMIARKIKEKKLMKKGKIIIVLC